MANLLSQLDAERGALIRKRDLALNRKHGFERKLKALRGDLKQAESRLRSAKRATLVGGPGRLQTAEEAELVKALTEGPVSEAALSDVIAETQNRIDEIDAQLLTNKIAEVALREDEVEVELLQTRLQGLDMIQEHEILRERLSDLQVSWEGHERSRKALGDTSGRPHPQDVPDAYARDAQGHERSRDETRKALQSRIAELEARLNGAEPV
jgi:hypothetical protein